MCTCKALLKLPLIYLRDQLSCDGLFLTFITALQTLAFSKVTGTKGATFFLLFICTQPSNMRRLLVLACLLVLVGLALASRYTVPQPWLFANNQVNTFFHNTVTNHSPSRIVSSRTATARSGMTARPAPARAVNAAASIRPTFRLLFLQILFTAR